jgi:hypothetical protein
MKNMQKIVSAVAICLTMSAQAFAAGAIAVNEDEGPADTGYSFVIAPSANLAARYASIACDDDGYQNCVVAVRFEQCGALAASSKIYRAAAGATIAQATERAMKNCPGCRVVKATCSEPQLTSVAAK